MWSRLRSQVIWENQVDVYWFVAIHFIIFSPNELISNLMASRVM